MWLAGVFAMCLRSTHTVTIHVIILKIKRNPFGQTPYKRILQEVIIKQTKLNKLIIFPIFLYIARLIFAGCVYECIKPECFILVNGMNRLKI
jgi:uncharacterized membrane protein SpoIIM required for sporulation